MPFDPFFSSNWKSKPRPGVIVRARCKRSWPQGSQYGAKDEKEKNKLNDDVYKCNKAASTRADI